jgi:hypothetical protein
MKLSEAITIYLAAGAFFGADNFLREQNPQSRVRAWLKAAHAALLWPFVAAKFLHPRQRPQAGLSGETASGWPNSQFIEKTNQASRKLMASLYRVIELSKHLSGSESERREKAARAVREGVEKYKELTLAAVESDADAPPSKRELELFRVAGRKGEDLLLAGRCLHRRNTARLVLHQTRARTELLHALAEIRELGDEPTTPLKIRAAHHLSVETLRFYACAFDLLSLLEDESAALSVARLLDAECVRLRRLETLSLKESRSREEESCRRHLTQTAFANSSQASALNQGSAGC